MASTFTQRQQKIQTKRKQTPRREFVRDIASWKSLNFYKNRWMISRYPESDRITPVSHGKFYGNRDGLLEYGVPVSWKWLFEDFWTLLRSVPLPALIHIWESENSSYADLVASAKYAYLSVTVFNECENVFYSESVKDYCSNIINSMTVWDSCEIVYSSCAVFNSREVFFSRFITDSTKVWFCSNMQGCFECIRCDGIHNKSYCIDNEQLPKAEYMKRKEEILRDKKSYDTLWEWVSTKSENLGSLAVSWNSLILSRDVENGKFTYRLNESRNVFSVWTAKWNARFYDTTDAGSPHGSDFYGVMWWWSSENVYCSVLINGCSQMYYSFYCDDCSYCVGCVGLQNKSYCIFNVQYEKDDWYQKVDELFGQMEEKGELGEFFSGSLCPLYFNDTAAALMEDFTKEEIIEAWYLRRDEPIRVDIPDWVDCIRRDELDTYEWRLSEWTFLSSRDCETIPVYSQWTIDPAVLKKVIQDEAWNIYRIIPMEYKFLKKFGLPLPRTHRQTRLKQHFRVG